MFDTSTYILSSSREYATYVMEQRAIPNITDGLKLSQRIALWLLKDQAKTVKTAGLVGRMMESNLYVHGDAAAGDLIGRLAAPYLNNHCLIQGEGAFGTRTAPLEGIGAPRYTEVKRSKFSEQELYVDLGICPMRDNYDGSKQMPRTFLPRIPLILLNGVNGIAIGFANKILPRDLDELREAVIEVLKTGKTTKPLMPTFCMYQCDVTRDHGNSNKFYMRGTVDILNTTTVKITELPPGKSLDTVKAKLIQLEDDKKISSFVDNSTDRINITVKMSRAALAKKTADSLVVMFGLVQPETENLTVLDPSGLCVTKYTNAQDIVVDFVNWRLEYYKTRYLHLLSAEYQRLEFWEVFLSCFSAIDGKRSLATSISGIKSKSSMKESVIESAQALGLEPDPEQPISPNVIERVVSLPVYKFTKEGQAEAKKNIKNTKSLIKEYEAIVASPTKRRNIYIQEVTDAL